MPAVLLQCKVRHDRALPGADAAVGGTASERTFTQKLLGYLAKPDGVGPFPAVVVLHGCGGFSPLVFVMADTLKSWGYAALAIDSLGPRGRANACLSGEPDQPLDAYAGLNFLAAQDFVDSDRIGVLGYSMGGGSALVVAERGIDRAVISRGRIRRCTDANAPILRWVLGRQRGSVASKATASGRPALDVESSDQRARVRSASVLAGNGTWSSTIPRGSYGALRLCADRASAPHSPCHFTTHGRCIRCSRLQLSPSKITFASLRSGASRPSVNQP